MLKNCLKGHVSTQDLFYLCIPISIKFTAKGNTLLNFSNITNDLIEFTVDKNPYKQKRFLPGSHISIKKPEMIMKTNPDFILILPWNIKDEIIKQIKNMKKWEGKFVIPIPKLKII